MKRIFSAIIAATMAISLAAPAFAYGEMELQAVSKEIISTEMTSTTIVEKSIVTYDDGTISHDTFTVTYPGGRPGVSRANSGTAYATKEKEVRSSGSYLGRFTFDAVFEYDAGIPSVKILSKSCTTDVDDPYIPDMYSRGPTDASTKSVKATGYLTVECPTCSWFTRVSMNSWILCDIYGNMTDG